MDTMKKVQVDILMRSIIDRKALRVAISMLVTNINDSRKEIAKWKNSQRKFKSGTMYYRSGDKFELFCVAWDRGQMSFLLMADSAMTPYYIKDAVLFEVVIDNDEDDDKHTTPEQVIDALVAEFPNSDYLYGECAVLKLPNLVEPVIYSYHNFCVLENWTSGNHGDFSLSTISKLCGIMDDIWLIPIYCIDPED